MSLSDINCSLLIYFVVLSNTAAFIPNPKSPAFSVKCVLHCVETETVSPEKETMERINFKGTQRSSAIQDSHFQTSRNRALRMLTTEHIWQVRRVFLVIRTYPTRNRLSTRNLLSRLSL